MGKSTGSPSLLKTALSPCKSERKHRALVLDEKCIHLFVLQTQDKANRSRRSRLMALSCISMYISSMVCTKSLPDKKKQKAVRLVTYDPVATSGAVYF